jgi:hypothetical protein
MLLGSNKKNTIRIGVGFYEAFWVLIFTLLGVTQADLLLAIG